MAKQTFTTGSVLTAQQMNDLQTNDFNQTVNQKTASYVLVASDKGTRIEMNSGSATTVTVNTGLFAAGDTLFIQNIGAGACTVTAGTATVNKAAAGSLTLAQYQGGTLYFISASSAVFFADAGFTSPLTTKGDLYTYSTTDARLPVGTNGQVLTAQSAQSTGLQWATLSATKNFSLLGTGTTTSGSTVTVSGISGIDDIFITFNAISTTVGGEEIRLRINADSGSNYNRNYVRMNPSTSFNLGLFSSFSETSQSSYFLGQPQDTASSTFSGSLMIRGCNTSGIKTIFSNSMGSSAGGSTNMGVFGGGIWNNSATVTSVSVLCSANAFDAGSFSVYGSA